MPLQRISKYSDISGQKFNRLTALKKVGINRDGRALWLFKCDCGNEHITNIKAVIIGHSGSCGCYAKELLARRNFKHGATKHDNISTPEWKSWASMKSRIANKSYHAYEHYKKRRITICDRWLDKQNGFNNFLLDMGSRPAGTSLDRIDNDKGYYPKNCRWATREQQMNNTSTNEWLEFKGERLTESQWARKLGFTNSNVIHKRLKRGWSLEKTLTTPLLSDWRVNDWRKA